MSQEFVARNGIIANNNSLIIGALTATTFIKSGGTSNQFLMADGSISLGSSSSGVTGNGTLNFVPKFSGSTNNIANSNIFDDGSLIILSSATRAIDGFTANTVSSTTMTSSAITFGNTTLNEIKLQEHNAALSTGLYIFTNSGITLGVSANTFNVGAVQGWIVNPTDTLNTNPIFVSFSGASGQTTPFISAASATYILINSASTLSLQGTRPTVTDRRNKIYLGVIGHPNGALGGIGNSPDIIMNELSQLRAMFEPTRLINDGVICSPNGANLNMNTSSGILYGLGIGFITNGNNAPSIMNISGSSPTTFQYRTQTGGTFSNTTLISAATYDVSGVLTAIPGPNATSTNQRIYLLQNGSIRIQFGQITYATLAAAISAAGNESFIVANNNRDLGILIGIISLRKDATDLSSIAAAQFLSVSKFGETVGAAAGISTSTLQTAYNNSADPEIVTNAVLGAVSVRRGSVLDTDAVFMGQNGGGTTRFLVDGNGGITGQSFVKSGGTNAQILLADGSVTGVTSFVSTGKTININGATQNLSGLTEFRTAQGDTGVLTYSSGLTSGTTSAIRIAPITGYIVDNETNPAIPTFTFVNYSGTTGITLTTLTGGTSTYVMLTTSGITFQNTFPTSAERKSKIWLGKVAHPSSAITAVINEPDYITSPQAFSRDLFQALNYINDGVYPYANGANLTVNITAGNIHGNGINLQNSRTIPNEVQMGPFVPMSFLYRTQTGGTGTTLVTSIDPNNYDLNGVITSVSGVTTATIQWIFAIPSAGFVVQYGQTIYATFNDAITNIGRETFTVFQNLIENAILIGVLAVTKGATGLSNTTIARFFRADKLGQIIGAQAGISTSTLQNAYDNSLAPQIVTTSTMGPLIMKGWDGGNSDIFVIQNSASTNTLSINEGGSITANTFVKSGGTSNQYLMADGSISTLSTFNTITGTGTTNTLSKFSSSSAITNSNITDTGSLITLSSNTRVVGTITATTIVKSGGTSNQFLKADGSIDSNTYITGITNVITGTGNTNTLPKFSSSSALTNSGISDDGITINIDKSILKTFISAGTSGTPVYEKVLIGGVLGTNESSISFGNNFVSNGGTEIKFTVNSTVGPSTPIDAMIVNSNGNILVNTTADTITNKLQVNGSILSTAFVKSGGTSNQFLKADGSIDSNVYITGITNVITGIGVTNYVPKWNSSSSLTNSLIYDTGTQVGLGTIAPSFGYIFHVSGATKIENGDLYVRDGGLLFGPTAQNAIYKGGTDFFIMRNYTQDYTINQIWAPPSTNVLTDEREATLALVREDTTGNAEFMDVYNNGYTAETQFGLRIQKRGTGQFRDFVIDYSTGVTNQISVLRLNETKVSITKPLLINTNTDNGIDKLQVSGSVFSTAFRKSGGTSAQFLKADGSSDSNTYLTTIPNVITGTGTNNIISKFNSISGITNSNISDNGTLVSISSSTIVIGAITGNSFVKTGGTSNQFLKADGSVDSTIYLTGIANNITGTGTTNIISKFNGVSGITNSNISDNGTLVSISSNTIVIGAITGNSFVKTGGTSVQFLKADGSVDSNTYLTGIANNITGTGTTNIISKFNGISGITNSNISDNGILITLSANTNVIGGITGNSFVKTGGTSNQFLKADGSVDSTIYITGIPNNITGTGTNNIIAKFNSASGITNSNITDTGSLVTIATATTISSGDLNISSGRTIVSGVGNYFYVSQGSLGNKYVSNKPGAGFFAQGIYGSAPNIRWGMGLTTDPSVNPTGETITIFDANAVGIGGITVNNTVDRLQVLGSVISSVGYKISGGTSAQFLKADGSVDSNTYITGIPNNITGTGTNNIVSKFNSISGITNSNIGDNGTLVSISSSTIVIGAITGNSFIKTGGTSNQFLKADGSVDSNTYITGIPNNITGTGTNNIITKFNSASGITNSNISDNGTLVSISSSTIVIGAITGNSFIKTGGTSNQFLKADGSVDSNTYITGIPNNITGTGTNNIVSKFNSASGITNSNISDNGTLVSISANTIIIGAITGNSFIKTGGTSNQFLKADGSVDSTLYYPASNPSGFTSGSSSSATLSGGITNNITKWSSSSAVTTSNMSDNGTLVSISSNTRVIGAITATTIIKSGGTSNQFLMADGSVSLGGSSSGVTGGGTINRIPKFSGASNNISDSNIMDDGSLITMSGPTLSTDGFTANTVTISGITLFTGASTFIGIDTSNKVVSLPPPDDMTISVTNKTGVSIAKGSVVYINGAFGTKPTIALALADSAVTTSLAVGITNEVIANDASGNVVIGGRITGLNTSTFTAGDEVYLSTTVAGGLSTSIAVSPNAVVLIGTVAIVHGTEGEIIINIFYGFRLDRLLDVSITGATDGQVLTYDGPSGIWKNETPTGGSSGPSKIVITTAVSITTDTLDTSGNTQDGKHVMIDNGASAINITVNGGPMFLASYEKRGTGTITFVQGAGRTVNAVDGTLLLDGKSGSTATVSSFNTLDYIRISNA